MRKSTHVLLILALCLLVFATGALTLYVLLLHVVR